MMKTRAWLLTVCLLGASCDYTVPLGERPEVAIEKAAHGLWQRTEEQRTERLVVLPLGEKEVLVVFSFDGKSAIYAKAMLLERAGMTLAQLTWLGSSKGEQIEDGRAYQYAAFEHKDDTLHVRLLNPAVVGRDIASTDALLEALTANAANPKLFRDPLVFSRAPEE